ncbi:MAG: hypothetical protein ABIJ09_05885 [Pseudomonadota bacterium]
MDIARTGLAVNRVRRSGGACQRAKTGPAAEEIHRELEVKAGIRQLISHTWADKLGFSEGRLSLEELSLSAAVEPAKGVHARLPLQNKIHVNGAHDSTRF